MSVPIALLDETGTATEIRVWIEERSTPFSTLLDARPARLAVDPRFDTFRRLAKGESSATLSSLFGAERGLILVPAEAPAAQRSASLDALACGDEAAAGLSNASKLTRSRNRAPCGRQLNRG